MPPRKLHSIFMAVAGVLILVVGQWAMAVAGSVGPPPLTFVLSSGPLQIIGLLLLIVGVLRLYTASR